jgi:serine/threonine protein kinase
LGTPNEKIWKEMKYLKNYIPFEEFQSTPFKVFFSTGSEDEIDLISKLLVIDPNKRITCDEVIKLSLIN